MNGTLRARLVCAVAVSTIGLVVTATQSVAADPPPAPDATVVFPAGLACAGFDLRVEIWNNQHRVFKEFTDKNGNVVRMLSAGKGSTLAFTNVATDEKFSLRPNGAVEHTTINPDGSQTVASTGHNVLILFPTDRPAGPSTTLYVGRIVYTVATGSGVFTLQSVSGTSSNICDALL